MTLTTERSIERITTLGESCSTCSVLVFDGLLFGIFQ
jgi:hypothetical protein